MDEEVKKEIEELKKEENGNIKQEERESAEELVEDLAKEEERSKEEIEVESAAKFRVFKTKFFYLKILGIVLSILGIIAGIVYLKFMFTPKQTNIKKSKETIQKTFKKETQENKKQSSKSLITKKVIHSVFKKEKELFGYKATLSNFLIPLSDKEFLKVEITVFFPNHENVKIFKHNTLVYRKFFYFFLKKVPSSVWYDDKKLEELSREAVKEMKLQNIKPVPIKVRFDGAILKA